jgi:phthiocerol/phenolphthiocerol synthesis type-I polyketide synthase E
VDGRIAVIGLACRVPGARDARQFWQNLVAGACARVELGRDELLAAGVPAATIDEDGFVPVDYPLDGLESFDAGLFGLTGREAALADPQHRLFLELCHAAFEDAGWDPARFDGDVGVYGGRGMETYRWMHVHRNRAVTAVSDHMTVGIGNHADAFTTLVSYRLDLRGPSVGVYTACSTSLVAVHVAAEALRAGECDMALAGGVTIELPQRRGYLHRPGGTESADGYCRPFDAAATGTVWGSGGGAVLLKRLSDAIADGDNIRAVILGNAVNNDGAGKVGFTAPSVAGQAAAIANALAAGDVDPRTVSYVEAHGTGTALGDPIEVAALSSVFGRDTAQRQWCALGSVKSNIGHLSQGAGVVGLIKTVLALEHQLLPATLGFTAPNPAIDFAASPFYVNATLAKWESDGPLRAGVSSFGIGGTNAHVVVEAAVHSGAPPAARPAYLLAVSARSAPALDAAVRRLATHLSGPHDLELADVAYTLRVGRVAHPHRTAVVATDLAGAVAALGQPRRRPTGVAAAPAVTFLFPGQGAQYAGMGRQLYAAEPVFTTAVDGCLEVLDGSVRDALFGGDDARLAQTALAQPALFTIEYALAQLWQSWGVVPAAMIGHSVGEYVAATLAGVFSLPEALRLVAQRGRLIQQLPPGAMLAVSAPADRLELPETLSIAAVNGPGTCVVSGPTADVERFAATLPRKVAARRLRTSHAFHSAMMEPVRARFAELVAAAGPAPPRLPFLSNRSGAPITAEQATDPQYWAAHLRQTVRFGDCVAHAVAGGAALFLECGPGRQLSGLARMQVPRDAPAPVPSLPGPGEPEVAACYAAAGRLWVQGVALRPEAGGGTARRVSLPGYPYERTRHWIEPDPEPAAEIVSRARRPLDDWFTVPGWRRLPPVPAAALPAGAVVLAADPLGARLAEQLRAGGTDVVVVRPGDRYAASPAGYSVRAGEPDDYRRLVRDVGSRRWIHAWSLAGPPAGADPRAALAAAELGLFALLSLTQALAAGGGPVAVDVVTAGTQQVLGGDLTRPEHALVAGVVRSGPYDLPGVQFRHIDLGTADPPARLVSQLAAELGTGSRTVALRGGHRWEPQLQPVRVPEPATVDAGLRPHGVYLVTGGLGALGLAVAEDLARRVRARVLLVGRSVDRAAAAVERVSAAGGQAHAVAADVTDIAALQAVRQELFARYGRLDGIVHAAGVAGGGLTETRTEAEMMPVLAAKVAGTLALQQVFGDLELDFVALFSSVVGTVGGFGEVDYCAANAYLDAYAQSEHGWRAPVRSLAWAGWRGDGMLARALATSSSTVDEEAWMTPEEGVAAFHRAIATDLGGHVLITPCALDARTGTGARLAQRPPAAAVAAADPVAGPGPGPGSADKVTGRVAAIWCAVLGVEDIQPDDDFFDLGGNSLVAVQLIAQVRKAFGVKLPMRAVFDTPTVNGMAVRVAQLLSGKAPASS